MGCLDDNTAVDFAGGSLPRAMEAKVEAHLATCRDCRTLVAALAPSAQDGDDSDIVTAPRHFAHGKKKHGANAAVTAALSPTAPQGSEPRRPLEPVVAVGDTISRYVVLRRIGAGGMGVVYAAYDPQLDRKVALKLLRTGIGLGEGEARARLVREAQAIAQLSHPNVVAVYDVGTTADGEVYVAMEFVDGDTLTQWLHRWDRPWREILEVFREAGRGLAAAHGVGLLHRDFKPDNVLVGGDGRVRVTDFGLARSLVTGGADEGSAPKTQPAAVGVPLRVTLTATGAVMGTPRYMAPEQLRGQDVSAAADQFGFCVALYEALYGHHPIPGDTAVKIVEENARAQAPAAPDRAPSWIWPILQRGLDPQPAKRFPSMSALLVELTPPTPSPRRRTYFAMAGAMALVLGGAAAATVLTPKPPVPKYSQADIERLLQRIEELIDERDGLLTQIAELLRNEERNEEQLAELTRKLDEKSQEIVTLREELSKVAGIAAVPKPKPRPIDAGGVSQLQLKQGAEAQLDRFAGCMREWAERSQGTAVTITIGFRIDPDGRVRDPASVGLDDRIVPQCLATALSAQMFPLAPRVTKAEIDIKYVEGLTRVVTRHLGTEEPSPRIEE